jgi:hypothetical protein
MAHPRLSSPTQSGFLTDDCLAVRRRYRAGPHERDFTLPHEPFSHILKSRLGIDGSDYPERRGQPNRFSFCVAQERFPDLTAASASARLAGPISTALRTAPSSPLSEQHNRPFSFRYFNPDGWSAPSFLNVERCCRRLLLNAQGPIYIRGLPRPFKNFVCTAHSVRGRRGRRSPDSQYQQAAVSVVNSDP